MKQSTPLVRLLLLIGLLSSQACHDSKSVQTWQPGPAQVSWVINGMNDVMMHDVTNPPLASRFFAYAMLAGYEVMAQNDSSLVSMTGRLNAYPAVPKPSLTGYSPALAALFAMLETAGRLQPSGKQLVARQQVLIDSCRQHGLPEDLIAVSQQYGQQVAKAIMAYAKKDGYNRISDYARYTPSSGEGNWFPTPPAFMGAVEPHFNKVRPFVIDSASVFKPRRPTTYSTVPGSMFATLTRAVCQTGTSLTDQQKRMASFWDCNPFAVQDAGHLQVGLKKMSPGAHWMFIAGNACRQAKVSFSRAVQVHTVLAITMMDAFIGCWDEKYRSNRIRPETAIHRLIDPDWKPFLQTPPFPEYLSGHSVVSAASSEVLTHYFGDRFAYTDTSEVRFGIAPRWFRSFRQAAQEAGLSRFYGGIHFMDSIDEGQRQGQQIGVFVLNKMDTETALANTNVNHKQSVHALVSR